MGLAVSSGGGRAGRGRCTQGSISAAGAKEGLRAANLSVPTAPRESSLSVKRSLKGYEVKPGGTSE